MIDGLRGQGRLASLPRSVLKRMFIFDKNGIIIDEPREETKDAYADYHLDSWLSETGE